MTVGTEPDRETLEAWLYERVRDTADTALDHMIADLSPEERAAFDSDLGDAPSFFEVCEAILAWHEGTLRRLYTLEQAWLAQPPGDRDDPEVRRRVIWEVLRALHPDEELGDPPEDAEAISRFVLKMEYENIARRYDDAHLPYGNPFVESIEAALDELAFEAAEAVVRGWVESVVEE